MSRQLVDVLYDTCGVHRQRSVERLVASLLTDGPAEHTIDCPTCGGSPWVWDEAKGGVATGMAKPCPDCTNGRQTVIVRADIQ